MQKFRLKRKVRLDAKVTQGGEESQMVMRNHTRAESHTEAECEPGRGKSDWSGLGRKVRAQTGCKRQTGRRTLDWRKKSD
jgi:hypothetical protein